VLLAFCFAQYGATQEKGLLAQDVWLGWSGGATFLIASLFYVGGCFLGDCQDLAFDRKFRPERPLPQGVLTPGTVHVVAWVLMTIALIFARYQHAYSYPFAGALALAIVIYAVFHKKNRILALILMGSCRALLILYALAVTNVPLGPLSFALACTVGLYTLFLSSVAATENNPQQVRFRKPLLVAMCALPLIAGWFIHHFCPFLDPVLDPLADPFAGFSEWGAGSFFHGSLPFAVFFFVYLAWTTAAFSILPKSKPAFVSRALAGFCLLDACLVAAISVPTALLCLVFFLCALGLQKLAPAT
jgi:4-hydroxybenzoate polyprenyltransferase